MAYFSRYNIPLGAPGNPLPPTQPIRPNFQEPMPTMADPVVRDADKRKPWADALLYGGMGLVSKGDWSGLAEAGRGIIEAREFNRELEREAKRDAERSYARDMDAYRMKYGQYRDEVGDIRQDGRDARADFNADRAFGFGLSEATRAQGNADRAFEYGKTRDGILDQRWQDTFDRDSVAPLSPGTSLVDRRNPQGGAVFTAPVPEGWRSGGRPPAPAGVSPSDAKSLDGLVGNYVPKGYQIDPQLQARVAARAAEIYHSEGADKGGNAADAVSRAWGELTDGTEGDGWLDGDPRVKPKKAAPAAPTNAGNSGQSGVSSPKGAPTAGDVVNGFRFKGGNPKDPNSWEPVA